ncbi:hypothetical protein BD309DRAFT_142431 [Dichomitus squalens]|nr:hypothetical protein BD309DRAFT_142431 [Dichomitus squalens]
MSSYHTTTSRPIPTGRRSPSPGSSAHSGSSQGDSDFSQGHRWRHHTPARSSSGHSSDLIFSMDPERRSNSGSPCLGVAGPPFLYDVPPSWNGRPPDTGTMSVCPRCRRQFYDDYNSPQSRGVACQSRNALCPSCRELESRQDEWRRRNEEFYASTPERPVRTSIQRPSMYESQHQVPTPTSGIRPTGTRNSSAAHATNTTHFIGRPFPSYVAAPPPYSAPPPYTRSVSHLQQPTPPWTDVSAHGPTTFVTGSYRPRYQLPQLITQLEHRVAPPPSISPGTADPFPMSPTSPPSRERRQS